MVTSQKTVRYEVHTIESAPPGGGEALAGLKASLGMIPSLAATMAESPELLKGFLALRQNYASTGHVGGDALESFVGAGFTKRQALDVVLGMGLSLLANYSGHLTEAPSTTSSVPMRGRASRRLPRRELFLREGGVDNRACRVSNLRFRPLPPSVRSSSTGGRHGR